MPLAIDHTFRDPELLRQALTHRSFGTPHNERLEFIGDAVLNCVIALRLYHRFPDLAEGELSRIRAHLVNRDTLARLARGLGLGAELRLGEGEARTGGADRPSALADALEAVFGAVAEDGGLAAAEHVIDRVFAELLRGADPATLGKDAKTRLQELVQARRMALPEYEIVATRGDAHAQSFVVVCRVGALDIAATGEGSSRRAAEQDAAARALAALRASGHG